jgi:hypothetical protein
MLASAAALVHGHPLDFGSVAGAIQAAMILGGGMSRRNDQGPGAAMRLANELIATIRLAHMLADSDPEAARLLREDVEDGLERLVMGIKAGTLDGDDRAEIRRLVGDVRVALIAAHTRFERKVLDQIDALLQAGTPQNEVQIQELAALAGTHRAAVDVHEFARTFVHEALVGIDEARAAMNVSKPVDPALRARLLNTDSVVQIHVDGLRADGSLIRGIGG